jgi:hypothetical protein
MVTIPWRLPPPPKQGANVSSARLKVLSIPAVLALAAFTATGCSSSPGASFDGSWGTAEEVIANANDGGFDCSFDKNKNLKQVLTEHPVTKEPLGGSLILCQGFQVLLLDDMAAYTASIKKDCGTVTKQSLASPAMERVVVIGDNYVISGTGPDQGYPAAASSAALAKAFKGQEKTMLEYYQTLCAGIPAIEGSPAPTSAL